MGNWAFRDTGLHVTVLYESITRIQRHLDSLRSVAQEGSRLRDPIARVDRAVDLALGRLEELISEQRQLRQEQITTEILEVISGAETLAK